MPAAGGPVAHVFPDRSARRIASPASLQQGPSWTDPAAVAYHGPRDEKVVALRSTTAGAAGRFRKLFRVLKEKHVNATFFPVGQAVRHDPTTWRRIATRTSRSRITPSTTAPSKGQCFSEQRLELTRARATYTKCSG